MIAGALLILVAYITTIILFILTVQSTLSVLPPDSRKVEPNMVWLILIPVFGCFWLAYISKCLSDSLDLEFLKRGVNADAKPLYFLGIAITAFRSLNYITIFTKYPPFVSITMYVLSALAIVFVAHWVYTYRYKKMLENLPRVL